MTRIILSTGNIVSGGPSIIRSPGGVRSNLELTNSLRGAITEAKQDYPDTDNDNDTDTDTDTDPASSAYPAWTEPADHSTLYVPRIHWAGAGLAENPAAYEITAKLFFLPLAAPADRAAYAADALALVRKELGAPAVDLLIISFPGLSFDGDCEWAADRLNAAQGSLPDELATWAALEDLHAAGTVRRLGLAECGSAKLQAFVDAARVKPAVDQISVRDCCKVPPPLARLAEKEGIELLAHTDSVDVLPSGTLRELLGHGELGAGLLAGDKGEHGLKGDVRPRWVVKYTAVVRDRGVIENKGYFAGADLVEA